MTLFKTITTILLVLFSTTPSVKAIERSMDTTYDLRLLAEAANDTYGYSSEFAGDVNGDGYQDLIIGAQGNDTAASNAGAAYIYYGGSPMNATVDVTLRGAAANDAFGNTATTAGDVNHDGYADVIVGANGNDSGGTDAGRAYIYFGGASMDSTADITLTGHTAGDQFGYSVSTAGDINGDGYSDVLVGAYGNDVGGSNAGRAYLFYGGASMDTTPDATFTGEAAGDQFGVAVNQAGKFNNDAYPDIVIGSNNNDRGGTNAGAAFVYFGSGDSIDTTVDLVLVGEAAGDGFAGNPPATGDVNNDGYVDMLVGSCCNDSGATNVGEAYLYYGGPSLDATADVTFTGGVANGFLGSRVGITDDMNGDGYRDVLVGASTVNTSTGAVYVFYGGSAMDTTVDLTFTGPTTNVLFSSGFIPFTGDLNGDGLVDLAIGAQGDDTVGSDAGAVYIFFGGGSLQNDGPGQPSSGDSGGTNDTNEPEAFPAATLAHPNKKVSGDPFVLKTRVPRTDAKKVYAVILGKKYPFYDDGNHSDGKKGDLVYGTNLLSLTIAKKTSYAVYNEYASQKTKSVGTLIPSNSPPSLASHIPSLFAQVYGRTIGSKEQAYWEQRITNGEKTSLAALIGALQWHKLFK